MPRLPCVKGQAAIRAFEKAGFSLSRIRGSHHVLSKAGHPRPLIVPMHGSTDVKQGTLRALIKASGLSIDEFVNLLD